MLTNSAEDSREKLEAAVIEYARHKGNEVLIAYVDAEGVSGALYSDKIQKIFTHLGNKSHRGFIDRMFTLISVVYASHKNGTIN